MKNKELKRQELFKHQNGKCYYCGQKMNLIRRPNGQPGKLFATFEHKQRRQDGGTNDITNLVLAHKLCNHWREIIRQSDNGKKALKNVKSDKWARFYELFKRFTQQDK